MEDTKTTVIGLDKEEAPRRERSSLESLPLYRPEAEANSLESIALAADTPFEEQDREFINFGIGMEIALPCEGGDILVRITDLISKAGDSGEASVYKVQDKRHRNLALKIYRFLRTEDEPNPVALERIKKISSAAILPLLAYGVGKHKLQGKYCWELQVFAEGGNLFSVRDMKSKYTAHFIEQEIIPQLLRGLWELHDHYIYHCDLKPQNIFYLNGEQSKIVIGDYGSAKTKELNTSNSFVFSKRIVGTHTYIPPEFHEGFIKDNSDYFSMGMIILELLYHEAFEEDPQKIKEEISLRRNRHEPIFNFERRYERLNKLIEGCTLASWDRRWDREAIENWQKGKIAPIIYRDQKLGQELKLTRQVVVKSVEELVDYAWSLSAEDFHTVITQDDEVFAYIQDWLFDQLSAYDAKGFGQIRKVYGLRGKDKLKEALLRYLDHKLPLVLDGKIFEIGQESLLKTLQKYLQTLLAKGMAKNPRLAGTAVFALENALLKLRDSEAEELAQDARYFLGLVRFILMEREEKDTALGSLVSCDEQENNSFLILRLELLLSCISELNEAHISREPEYIGLVNRQLNKENRMAELFGEAQEKDFRAFELVWWQRLLHPAILPVLSIYKADARNNQKVAAGILQTLYELSWQEDKLQYLASEIKALDATYQKLDDATLEYKMQRLLTQILVLDRIASEPEREQIRELKSSLPYDYQFEDLYPPWGITLPDKEKTLIKLAWCCHPQRGIRTADSLAHPELSSFILAHLRLGGDDKKALLEASEYCNQARGMDKPYTSFYNLLLDINEQLDDTQIRVEAGKDVDIGDLLLNWTEWSIKCEIRIYPSLILHYSEGGVAKRKEYCSYDVEKRQRIEMKKAFSLGKSSLDGRINLNNPNAAEELELLIVKGILGDDAQYIQESGFHEKRLREIKRVIPETALSYRRHRERKAQIRKENGRTWLKEGFRWLSLGLIVPLTWLAYALSYELNPALVPLFLYLVPLILLAGALPFFHEGRGKWGVLSLTLLILVIAFFKGHDSLQRLQILLIWQRFALFGIFWLHLRSFLNDDSYQASELGTFGNRLLFGMGLALMALLFVKQEGVRQRLMAHEGRIIRQLNEVYIPAADIDYQGRRLKLNAYHIAEREVSVADFAAFCQESEYQTQAERGEGSLVFPALKPWYQFYKPHRAELREDAAWQQPYFKQGENHPVVCVSFLDAIEYCNWLSKRQAYTPCYSFYKGKLTWNPKADGYRLPTEAEWQWAASGAELGGYYLEYKNKAWYRGNLKKDAAEEGKKNPFMVGLNDVMGNIYDGLGVVYTVLMPSPWKDNYRGFMGFKSSLVKKAAPNGLRLYDMLGNVNEWCWDIYQEELPAKLPDNYRGAAAGDYRCIRGISRFAMGDRFGFELRGKNEWNNQVLNSASFIGFRVARNAKD